MTIKIIESDKNLIKYGQSWIGVPLFLNDGLLMPLPSEWTLDMKIQRFSKNTVISYAKTIALWLESLEDSVDVGTAQMFIYMLKIENVGDGTIKLRMIHIQEFYRWALNKGYIQRLLYEIKRLSLKEGTPNNPTIKLPNKHNRKVKPQSIEDFERVLAANPRKSSDLAKRDEFIAEIARYMGLRRSEVVSLTKQQFLELEPTEELLLIEIVIAKSQGRIDSVLVPKMLLQKILQKQVIQLRQF